MEVVLPGIKTLATVCRARGLPGLQVTAMACIRRAFPARRRFSRTGLPARLNRIR
jgi:hypothetical protein